MKKTISPFSGKVAKNAGWLIGGNIAQKILAFLVGVWTARYLGPDNYGLINYAAAYTTFFSALSTLGINSIIVKEFVDMPEEEGTTLGTTLILQCMASLLSIVCILLITLFLDFEEKQTNIVVILASFGLLFQTFDTVKYWFQAKLESKNSAVATLVAYSISSAYKILLLIHGKSVEWFAVSSSIDYICTACILLRIYKKKGGMRLHFSWNRAKELLSSSRYYILAGLMVSIYGATDKLMLKQMLDESAVGYYGTAVSVCNVWVFILAAIIESMNPTILEAYKTDKSLFEKRNRTLYAIVFYFSAAVSVFMTVFAKSGIKLLFGENYLPAASQLRIITWYVAFSYLGVARNAWIVCENQQKYLLSIYTGSAVINVILNAVLIPIMGANGAAIASLVTQFSTIFLFPLLLKGIRPNAQLMIEAITLRKLDNVFTVPLNHVH